MSNKSAVCINCGQFKKGALGSCSLCGFTPSGAQDEARSLMLSLSFDAGEHVIGLPASELQHAAELIQNGGHYAFEPKALENVLALHVTAQAVTPRQLVTDFLRWILPPVLLLAALFMLMSRT